MANQNANNSINLLLVLDRPDQAEEEDDFYFDTRVWINRNKNT